MRSFQIIVGSMLGGTEYVAEACQEALEAKNHQTMIHLTPKYSEVSLENQILLVITSTHGAGDYPDNIKSYVEDLEKDDRDLSTVEFIVIGIGDSSYDQYCQAAKNIENLLISKGCKMITESKLFDMQDDIDPEELSAQWISAQIDQLI
ncbi:flavodoxin domain-containing protein [Thalassotalea atypica]|uniref:flavodoxin domain-containing protein n=1 Tax=Thalassotalea atypica TaxID=2054316 RepID=UPI0025739A3B|nr:flavodoxin domain-containing protein [Thalassotalea atypica]